MPAHPVRIPLVHLPFSSSTRLAHYSGIWYRRKRTAQCAVEPHGMRLLDTSSYELSEFIGENIPPYAILSHTWGEGEVLFHDIQNKTARSKKGFEKLVGCCTKAVEDDFEWVWIDTCCIDKTSSAELSEAINSMYQWYKDSVICYAYLEDVTKVYFTKSRWFTRGWTLQELIAPRAVEFYTSVWVEIGTKRSLATQIETVTGIPAPILRGEDVSTCNVAERMSWASQRQTTRREDMAYCLLGLFQVNMPLLYGEGDKAFLRLQEQILRQEEDYSIFAWTLHRPCLEMTLAGCLATSPAQFAKIVPQNPPRPEYFEGGGTLRAISSGVYMPTGFGGQALFADPYSQNDVLADPLYDSRAYRVMVTKDYQRFCRPSLSPSIATPLDPPELTARGVRISLLMRKDPSPWLPVMAWIHCEVDERLVCILLKPLVTGSTRVLGRFSSSLLVSVDKTLVSEFELTEVFLLPSGLIDMTSGLPSRDLLMRMSGRSNESRVSLELSPAAGYGTRIIPVKYFWRQTEFYVRDERNGVFLIECTHGDQDTAARFEVSYGVLDRSLWCSIKELSGAGSGNKAEDQQMLEDLEKTLAKLEDLRKAYEHGHYRGKALLSIPDRAAKLSKEIPGMMVSAAIRPRPKNEWGASQFILRVSVGEIASCEGWAQVYAWQERARLGDEAGTKP